MKRIVLIAAAAVLAAEVFVPAVYAKEEERSSPGEKLETYHRNPAPESIPALLREIDAAALNQHAYPPIAGFFFELCRANPDRVAGWLDIVGTFRNPLLKRYLLPVASAAVPAQAEKVRSLFGPELPARLPSMEEIRKLATVDPDFAWGAYFASGKEEYVFDVLNLVLSRIPKRKKENINLTAFAAHWSLLALSQKYPEVETILRNRFRSAPEEELCNFFRSVDVPMRRRFLSEEQLAQLPPPEENPLPERNNPFAGIYRNWKNRKTSAEETQARVDAYEQLFLEEFPAGDHADIRTFFDYYYRGNLPPLKPEEVESTPRTTPWAEAARITRLYRSSQFDAARKALSQLPRILPGSFLGRVLLLQFCRNGWGDNTPEFERYGRRIVSEIEAAVFSGKWRGRCCYQWFYNHLSRESSCGSRYWGELENRLKPFGDKIDPWFREMVQGRAAIAWAWESRGGGWANTVTEEGWKGFHKNLRAAREHFHAALKLHPERVNPYIQLISVEMGESNQEAMIDAFKKLVWYDPENSAGFSNILWGILPRWGGSHELIRQLAIEAMDCPRRELAIPAMGYQCLAEIAWDYPGIGWQNVYLDPEIRKRSNRLFDEYGKRAAGTSGWNNFLFHRFSREMAELRYDDAAATLKEYGGAEKFAKSGRWQWRPFFAEEIGTPWFDDQMLRLKLFTGKFAEPLRALERRLLARQADAETFRKLAEIIREKSLSVEEREFLIDFYARWRLNRSPQEYCGNRGKILSAFAVAGKSDRPDVAMEMVRFGYRFAAHENYPGEFAYNIVQDGKNPRLLQVLHEAGDPLNRPDPEYGYAPLHVAARFGNAEMVEALLKLGVPIEQKNRSGHTALHLAATWKQRKAIRVLLKYGADPNLGDNDGDVCLMYLPQVRTPLAVYQIFTEYPGIDLNRQNHGGETALHFMARSGTPVSIVRHLIERGAKSDLRDHGGRTVLDVAEQNNHRNLVAYRPGIGAKRGSELPPPPAPVAAPGSAAAGRAPFGLRPEYLYGVAGGLLFIALLGSLWKRRRNRARGE